MSRSILKNVLVNNGLNTELEIWDSFGAGRRTGHRSQVNLVRINVTLRFAFLWFASMGEAFILRDL